MVAKLYRYTIPQNARNEWERITKEARAIYKEHGMEDTSVLVTKTGGVFYVTEINYYATREAMEKVTHNVDRDPRIQPLFNAFLNIVPRDGIQEEICEVVG